MCNRKIYASLAVLQDPQIPESSREVVSWEADSRDLSMKGRYETIAQKALNLSEEPWKGVMRFYNYFSDILGNYSVVEW
jgi:hypothetical protein